MLIGWLAVAFLSACSSSSSVDVSDLNRQFIAAWNAKDSAKVIDYLADDVQFLQGETHFTGKAEVAQKWVRETLPTIRDLKTNVVSSAVDAQTAYEGGTFSVDVLPESPQEPGGFGEGNFMLLWRKGADGNWKLSYAQLEGLPVRARN